jgi:hypothetical protein
MKKYCGAAAPNIRLACQNFRVFESTASDGFFNACKENALSIGKVPLCLEIVFFKIKNCITF